MATIELHFLHGKMRIRLGVIKDMPTPVYNGFVEVEADRKVYHFRSKLAFPVYQKNFGATADAISLALCEAKALAKELIAKEDLFEKPEILDRGVFIYDYFQFR